MILNLLFVFVVISAQTQSQKRYFDISSIKSGISTPNMYNSNFTNVDLPVPFSPNKILVAPKVYSK